MSTTLTIHEPSIDAVQNLAADFRQFVASLGNPRLGDRAWVKSMQERCRELSRRFGQLRDSLAARRENIPAMITDLRATLRSFGKDLADRYNSKRLQDVQAALVRRYEDFVAYMHKAKIWGAGVRPRFRSLRLPKAARSVFHAVIALSAVVLYQFVLTQTQAVIILLSLLSVFTVLEVSRRFSPRFNDFMVYKVFGAISRPQERYKTNSASYYLLALVIITLLTPHTAVCLAVLVLGFGDPVASFVGSRWGKYRLANDKSLIGFLSFFAVSLLASLAYLVMATSLPWSQIALIAGCIAMVGALVELFSHKFDDNFTIPVACALTGLIWF
jgi:dolichol kinase